MICERTNKYDPLLLLLLTFVNVPVCPASMTRNSCCSQKDYASSMMFAESEDSCQATHCATPPHKTNKAEETVFSDSTALAVVLYKEENLLPHEKRNRSFTIAGHNFYIEQDWRAGGVAAVVWDAALVLGEYLAMNVHLVQNRRILELGAGTGLAGMVASSLGGDVIVTEREEALSYLKTAVSSNKAGKNWKIKAAVLDWIHSVDSNKWSNFDLVIGADIIYIESTFSHLLKTLKSVASSPKTQVLLSCRIRYDRDLHFINMLKEIFIVEEIFYNAQFDIKIFSAISKL